MTTRSGDTSSIVSFAVPTNGTNLPRRKVRTGLRTPFGRKSSFRRRRLIRFEGGMRLYRRQLRGFLAAGDRAVQPIHHRVGPAVDAGEIGLERAVVPPVKRRNRRLL